MKATLITILTVWLSNGDTLYFELPSHEACVRAMAIAEAVSAANGVPAEGVSCEETGRPLHSLHPRKRPAALMIGRIDK